PMTAVVVAGGELDRQVSEPKLLVGGNLSPHTGVAGIRPGVLLPRVVPVLARLRNRVEDPEPLAALHVVAADVTLFVAAALGISAGLVRGADNDDVSRDGRRRMQPDFTGDEVHFLV